MPLSQRRARLVGRLRTRRLREREGAVLVEGVRAAREALAAGVAPSFAVVSDRLRSTDAGRDLADRLEAEVETIAVDDEELGAHADTEYPQGVLLVCPQPLHTPDTLPRAGGLLVLDGVQDPGNVGTLLRSAAAFGFAGAVCLDGTADPWGAKTVRASAGTIFRLPVWSMPLPSAIAALTDRQAVPVVADGLGRPAATVFSELRAGRTEADAPPLALVVGNEGAGVRTPLRDAARAVVAVPMRGPVESLNAGVAGSILMYAWSAGVGEAEA